MAQGRRGAAERQFYQLCDLKMRPRPPKRIRPRVGWLPIGRTRPQWRDAQKREEHA
jgi:hypothetical protein